MHRFGIGHPWKFTQIQIQQLQKQPPDHLLGDRHDLLFVEKAGLDIDLGKFGLAVGAQVFVAEAFGDLIVAIHTGNHQ